MPLMARAFFWMLTGQSEPYIFTPPPPGNSPSPAGVSGIYIHIPFCRSTCPFCPYNKVLFDKALAHRYDHAVREEARQLTTRLSPGSIKSVYVGGGTPTTMLSCLEKLLDILRPSLAGEAEVAVELHPGDCSPETLARLRDAGMTMSSLGVQSFDSKLLASLGRTHCGGEARASLEQILNLGVQTVNVDLMMNLPGQTAAGLQADMEEAVRLGATQISAYPLILFPFTPLKPGVRQASIWAQWRMLSRAAGTGGNLDYQRSSVWTWTKPGSSHYSSITRDSFWGLGAGAASLAGNQFWLNTFDVEAYVTAMEGEEGAVALVCQLSTHQEALYRTFWKGYDGTIDPTQPGQIRSRMDLLLRLTSLLNLTRQKSGQYHLTGWGFFIYHLLERYYTRAYIGRLWQACYQQPHPDSVRL